jgi:hypothetical protein
MLKYANIPYIPACHLQIEADPDPDYHFDADSTFQFDTDQDPQHWSPDIETFLFVFDPTSYI